MFIRFLISLSYFLLVSASENTSDSDEIRGRALFGATYTTTVTKTNVVTSLVPSSCIQVAPTLPPCRDVRYLRFPRLPEITFNHPSNQQVLSKWKTESSVEPTSLGWGEYLGLYAPTVTVTVTDLQISTVEDPSVVVTFAIRGCRPVKLPVDLQRCPQETPTAVLVEETLQTSTVLSPGVATESLLPTRTMSAGSPSATADVIQDHSDLLEASHQEPVEDGSARLTDILHVQMK